MLSVEDYGMPDVYFAICKDDGKFYLYNKSNISNSDTGKFVACNMKDSYIKTEVDDLLKTINHRVTSFPTPSADEEGKLYQYIGVTDNKYTYGHFYTCEKMNSYSYILKSDITSDIYYNESIRYIDLILRNEGSMILMSNNQILHEIDNYMNFIKEEKLLAAKKG